MKADGTLKVDLNWYLAQQILPPVSRLCENIEGTDVPQLASCLGISLVLPSIYFSLRTFLISPSFCFPNSVFYNQVWILANLTNPRCQLQMKGTTRILLLHQKWMLKRDSRTPKDFMSIANCVAQKILSLVLLPSLCLLSGNEVKYQKKNKTKQN